MAIAFDFAAAHVTGGTDVSWSHTCTGSNLVLVVTGNATGGYSSMTYNSVALTKAISVTSSLSTQLQIWYLINPATGSHTIATVGTNGRIQSASYTGVRQTSFPDATAAVADQSNTGAGNNTVPLFTTNAECWVVGTDEDQILSSDAGVIITTKRGGTTFFGNGAINDSNGSVARGSLAVGYHEPGDNTISIVAMSLPPVNVNGNALTALNAG